MAGKEDVMIELTPEQRQELMQAEPAVIDPQTRETYVLVRKEVYDRLKGLLEDDDPRLMYPALADIDPEDWEDASVSKDKPSLGIRRHQSLSPFFLR
jgi:hypothetical protein